MHYEKRWGLLESRSDPYFVIAYYMIDKDELDSVHTIIIILQSNMQSRGAVFNQLVIKPKPPLFHDYYNGSSLFCFVLYYKLISFQ